MERDEYIRVPKQRGPLPWKYQSVEEPHGKGIWYLIALGVGSWALIYGIYRLIRALV